MRDGSKTVFIPEMKPENSGQQDEQRPAAPVVLKVEIRGIFGRLESRPVASGDIIHEHRYQFLCIVKAPSPLFDFSMGGFP